MAVIRYRRNRKRWVVDWREAGVDKKTVMEWVGQKTSGITDHYTHMIPERMSEWREKVNRGVNVGQEFISDVRTTVRPLRRPNGDQLLQAKKNPPKLDGLGGFQSSGGGIRTHDQVVTGTHRFHDGLDYLITLLAKLT